MVIICVKEQVEIFFGMMDAYQQPLPLLQNIFKYVFASGTASFRYGFVSILTHDAVIMTINYTDHICFRIDKYVFRDRWNTRLDWL